MVKTPSKTMVLDSCIGRRCYENPAYLDMLKLKIDCQLQKFVFTTVTIYEINKRTDYGFDAVQEKLELSFRRRIQTGTITSEMYELSDWLREHNEGLHLPDDQILAYTMMNNYVLITCDKILEQAAKNVGQLVINPDNPTSEFSKNKSTIATRAQSKASQLQQKINKPSKILKNHTTKIIWRSFN